jgi:YD repeat-containing protein
VGPEGDVFVADASTPVVRRRAGLPAWQGEGDRVVPSARGDELYVFEAVTGRHLRTVDARTGAPRLTLGWGEGGLRTLTDAHANVTTFERDDLGVATAIVGPFGHRTALGYDANGFVSSVTDPAGGIERLGFRADGLLETHTDPMGRVHRFDWDEEGRLASDESPSGGTIGLVGTRGAGGGSIEVVTTSPLGTAAYRLRRRGRCSCEAVAPTGS